MRLCKNCCYMREPNAGLDVGEYAKCAYGLIQNPVTGDFDMPTQSMRYCITLRQSTKDTDCGPDARFFHDKIIPPGFGDFEVPLPAAVAVGVA